LRPPSSTLTTATIIALLITTTTVTIASPPTRSPLSSRRGMSRRRRRRRRRRGRRGGRRSAGRAHVTIFLRACFEIVVAVSNPFVVVVTAAAAAAAHHERSSFVKAPLFFPFLRLRGSLLCFGATFGSSCRPSAGNSLVFYAGPRLRSFATATTRPCCVIRVLVVSGERKRARSLRLRTPFRRSSSDPVLRKNV